MTEPLVGSSLTSAPAVVTATMPGRPPGGAGAALVDETTTGALLAGGVTVTVLRGAGVPAELHAASTVRTDTADAATIASRDKRTTTADIANLKITQG